MVVCHRCHTVGGKERNVAYITPGNQIGYGKLGKVRSGIFGLPRRDLPTESRTERQEEIGDGYFERKLLTPHAGGALWV